MTFLQRQIKFNLMSFDSGRRWP